MRTIGLLLPAILISACGDMPAVTPQQMVLKAMLEDDDAGTSNAAQQERVQSDTPVQTPMPAGGPNGPFDRRSTAMALGRASNEIQTCWRPGDLVGPGHVKVTYEPSGRTSAVVLDGPYLHTRTEECIVSTYRQTAVPQFGGSAVMLGKAFVLRDATPDGIPAFDENAAKKAVESIDLSSCSSIDGPTGIGEALVNFSSNGRVTLVKFEETDALASTNVGQCVASKIQSAAHIAPYIGGVHWVFAKFRVPESRATTTML